MSTRLRFLAHEVRDLISVDGMRQHDLVAHHSIPAFDAQGRSRDENPDTIESDKCRVAPGDVLISKLNPRKTRVQVVQQTAEIAVASPEFVAIRTARLDPRAPAYMLRASTTRQQLDASVKSVTRSQQRVLPSDILNLPVHDAIVVRGPEIAEFLDRECARIDELTAELQELAASFRDAMGERITSRASVVIRVV